MMRDKQMYLHQFQNQLYKKRNSLDIQSIYVTRKLADKILLKRKTNTKEKRAK